MKKPQLFETVPQYDPTNFDAAKRAWERLSPFDRQEFFAFLHFNEGITEIDKLVKGTPQHKEYMLTLDRKISLEVGLDNDLPPTSRVVKIGNEK